MRGRGLASWPHTPRRRDAAGAIRVTQIGTLPPIKGVSPYTSQLVESLSGHPDVTVEFIGFRSLYPSWAYPAGAPAEEGVITPTFAGVRIRNILRWYDPFSWLRAGFGLTGEIVHAQWWSYVLAPIYVVLLGIARMRGKRVVVTVHNVAPHESGRVKIFLYRVVFRLADKLIVHCAENKATLQQFLGCSEERIVVIPHGILETPREGLDQVGARERLGLPTDRDRKVLLCFGNIRPYKGVDVLLRAFAEVLDFDQRAILVIAGRPWTSWEPYSVLIDELDIAENVRLFLDFIPTDQVEAFFVASDVVVLPYTQFDAQSGVAALALPYRKPLVVTDVGGLPELVADGRFVVPPGEVACLAEALTDVLMNDEVRKRLEADAGQRARELQWDAIAQKTAALYCALSNAAVGNLQDASLAEERSSEQKP